MPGPTWSGAISRFYPAYKHALPVKGSTPYRLYIWARRYKGKWSVYLLTRCPAGDACNAERENMGYGRFGRHAAGDQARHGRGLDHAIRTGTAGVYLATGYPTRACKHALPGSGSRRTGQAQCRATAISASTTADVPIHRLTGKPPIRLTSTCTGPKRWRHN